MTARRAPDEDSDTLCGDSRACPTKNETKLVSSATTSATAPNTSALATYTTPRRGMTVSDVLIIPVEYSDVMISAPSTTMMSWPRNTRPNRLFWTGSNVALSEADRLLQCDLVTAAISAPSPTLTTTSASSVQYVDRTDLILVHSDRSTPPSPA